MSDVRIVTNAELQKALDWLRDSASDLGNAKARAVKAGHMLKLKAANEALRVSNASALGFILKHQIGRSLEGYGVRKLLSETLREAA